MRSPFKVFIQFNSFCNRYGDMVNYHENVKKYPLEQLTMNCMPQTGVEFKDFSDGLPYLLWLIGFPTK